MPAHMAPPPPAPFASRHRAAGPTTAGPVAAVGLAFALALGLGAGTSGCEKATADNIELWKTTEKGPSKLVAAVGDRSLDPALRARAAIALVAIGKLEDVDAKLVAMPANERWELSKALIPAYVDGMKEAAAAGAAGKAT